MNLLKLETLKSLPARGYAYLFAKPDKSLAYVDENGLETNLLAGKPDPNLPVVANIPYTAFDFSNTPDGPLPANDAYGNPIYLEVPSAGLPEATPLISGGGVRVTSSHATQSRAFYMGLKQNGVIYEMGAKVILGTGTAAFVITQGTNIFSNWNWPLHMLVSQYQVSIQLFNAGAGVNLKGIGVSLPTTTPIDVVVKFRESTVYVFINGAYIGEATDSRISSFNRVQAIFEPFQNAASSSYTKFISGYTKTSKQASAEITGIVNPPARQLEVTIPSTITLTGTDQVLMGYSQISMVGISEAMVTVRLRVNQTSPGDIVLNVEGFTVNAVTTTNFAVISKTVKDDIVTAVLNVKGIAGANIRILIKGAFGTIPATGTNDKMLVSVVPTAWTS